MEATPSARGWRERALCRGAGPELFFTDDDVSVATALALCAACPVREDCLAEALLRRECGVWGGTTEADRHPTRRRHLHRTA